MVKTSALVRPAPPASMNCSALRFSALVAVGIFILCLYGRQLEAIPATASAVRVRGMPSTGWIAVVCEAFCHAPRVQVTLC